MKWLYAELYVEVSILIDRLRVSWEKRRWIKKNEYYRN